MPPFLFCRPTCPCRTFFRHSGRLKCGLLRETARFLYSLASPLQLAHPAFPPFCSPASNSCCGPSPWKSLITSVICMPFKVVTVTSGVCRQAFLVLIHASCSTSDDPHLPMCTHEVFQLEIAHQCSPDPCPSFHCLCSTVPHRILH